jgi:hypothetical protein
MGMGHGKTEHYSASRYSVSIKPAGEANVQKLVASNGRSLLILANNVIHQDQALPLLISSLLLPVQESHGYATKRRPQQEEEPFK